MYDFANSAFAGTILAVIFNRYYAGVIAGGEAGVPVTLFGVTHQVHGAAMFNFVVTISMLLVALTAPVLGAWADARRTRKRFLIVYIIIGVVSTAMLATTGPGKWLWGGIWFILANFAFAGGNVYYNSFLRELASPDEMGRVSGIGWGVGYLGSGLMLLLNLVMLQKPTWLGFPEGSLTVHHTFLAVAGWWALFSLPLILNVQEKREGELERETLLEGAARTFGRLRESFRHVRRYRQLWRFLLAYLFFNDGVETVILMAAIFGDEELGMGQGLLIGYFLLIQFTAFGGSLLFGRISSSLGNKRSLMTTLYIWCAVVVAAYFIGWTGHPIEEYFVLGIVAGMVMGASQSLARALQGTFTPVGYEAEFFGFFAVSGRFASLLGPLTYGAIVAFTGSLRLAILALALFFAIGILLLWWVDEEEGRQAALVDPSENDAESAPLQ